MHIYAINDSIATPETNDGLIYLGRIYLEDHMSCESIFSLAWEKNYGIHPFEDTRLYSEQVLSLSNQFSDSHLLESEAVSRIRVVLNQAVGSRLGILSFSD